MQDKTPLFNSKILKLYLEYIAEYYPEVDPQPVLNDANITRYEIDEPGHWFDTYQVDIFYQGLVHRTGNTNLARDAGRFITSARVMGTAKKFFIGLMDTTTIYMQIDKNYPVLSRAANTKTRKIGPNKVEITSTPKPGVQEKPYMCDNRKGIFESLAKIFTGKLATVEETSCLHNGGDCCRYIIKWQKLPSQKWKKTGISFLLIGLLFAATTFRLLPQLTWLIGWISFLLTGSALLAYTFYLQRLELSELMQIEGGVAKALLDEIDIRHGNAMLIQEIGQSISNLMDVQKIIETVMATMAKYLDLECGIIFMPAKNESQQPQIAGYGCQDDQTLFVEQLTSDIAASETSNPLVLSYRNQKPVLVNDTSQEKIHEHRWVPAFLSAVQIQSFICTPITYDRESIGILCAYNTTRGRRLTQSDLSLLMGVAAEISISVVNALSFHRLQESEERYRLLAENINDVIWKSDLNLNWSYISPSFEKLTGFSQGEAMKLSVEKLVTPTSLENTFQVIGEKLAQSNSSPNKNISAKMDVEFFCKNGSTTWVEVDAVLQRDETGNPIGIIGVSRDINERKRADLEKRELESQLQQKHKMEAIGTLAGGIAHDFNNILGIILGNTELSLDDIPAWNPTHQNLQKIKAATLRAKDIVLQLLNFTRQSEQQKKPLNIIPIIHESLKLLRATIGSSIEIQTDMKEISHQILADPIQIHQLIINLGTNAAHAMADKGGSLRVQLEEIDLDGKITHPPVELPEGRYISLTITDTGHGISPTVIDRIFDPYFTTKEIGQGTGMGLSVVHGIVKNIGGSINVSSIVGHGTTFRIYLPFIAEEGRDIPISLSDEIPNGREHLLLVDDEELIIQTLETILKRIGYRVTCKSNSVEALEAFQQNQNAYDLVITDMTMPHITGDRLAEKILAIRKDIPIILCTGFSDGIDEKRIRDIGIKALIMKPVETKELAQTIRKVMH